MLPVDSQGLFYNNDSSTKILSKLTNVELEKLDVSYVQNFDYLFANCTSLNNIRDELYNWNARNLKSLSQS